MDASVGFLLENLKQLVEYQVKLIGGAKHELEQLNAELATFKAILEDASNKYKKDHVFQQCEREIREAVYDIEDTIDTCLTQASAGKRNWARRLFSSKGISLAEDVKALRLETVKPLMDKFHLVKFSVADPNDTRVEDARKTRQQKTQHIVGFEAETKLFVDFLTRETDTLEICSVIGMAGLGKTTFAWKIFEDSTIKFEFSVLIWVNVSENLNMRKVLLDILSKFTASRQVTSVISDEDLVTQVKDHLKEGKFFMVLDDIWEIEAWKKIKALLTTDNKLGRVLITTRNQDVGINASASREQAHHLRFLTAKESWELLRYQVFDKLDGVPKELEGIGKHIANRCKGLPLSIVVIGGILGKKTSRAVDITAIKDDWEEVCTSLKSYLVEGDVKGLLGSIISLSYEKLPYELRNCFLYLGVFPEDADIPVKKLIRLWIAEGFVQQSRGKTMEEVANNNLKELINRNLVMVRKARPGGEAKICHIHDSVREICKTEGGKLNLFSEISKSEPQPDIDKVRRLCIHSQAFDFFSKKPKLPKARSFLCFIECPIKLDAADITSITDAFGLLRVYDAIDIKFPKISTKLLQQLIHLRYLTLAVATELKVLPEAVNELWNLQTLIVDTASETLEFKGDIFKMRHLRHVNTQASISMKTKGDDEGGEQLQTLSRLAPKSCTVEVCKKARSLVTLGIQGDLRILGDTKCLEELDSLMKLKLVHEVSRGGAADFPLRRLPDSRSFPPKLKTLVLTGTRLEWAKMSTFSMIDSLEVLKLKENAFQGSTWEAVGSGFFVRLICLHIERAGDLERWVASNDHFPKLRFLYINNCEKLSEIPTTLGKSLEMMYLERVSENAVVCARDIVEEQLKNRKREIKLEIAAADITRKS